MVSNAEIGPKDIFETTSKRVETPPFPRSLHNTAKKEVLNGDKAWRNTDARYI